MKVCIVAEGCYPYVVGGVSSWINSMIKAFPDIEFVVLAIVANRSYRVTDQRRTDRFLCRGRGDTAACYRRWCESYIYG